MIINLDAESYCFEPNDVVFYVVARCVNDKNSDINKGANKGSMSNGIYDDQRSKR